MMIRVLGTSLIVAGLMAFAGCGPTGNEARKLTPPEDVDWEAIEAEGSEMAEAQKLGE